MTTRIFACLAGTLVAPHNLATSVPICNLGDGVAAMAYLLQSRCHKENYILPKPHSPCYIAQLVHDKEVSLVVLAATTQIPLDRLARIIRGWRRPRAPEARRLARQIGMPITMLWPGVQPKRRK